MLYLIGCDWLSLLYKAEYQTVMQQKEISHLLAKVQAGTATMEEENAVKLWLHQLNQDGDSHLSDLDLAQARVAMWEKIKPNSIIIHKSFGKWKKLAVAASLIFGIGTGSYFLYNKFSPPQTAQTNLVKSDLLPGRNKAILTLASGKKIILTGTSNGKVATEKNAIVNKSGDGLVTYRANDHREDKGIAFNTLVTPKGGQYTLLLSDGTRVMLNAASSITFPVVFAGSERRVKLIGEAYFEVAHNKSKPFHVESKGQDVEVIGTHFNVNSYSDEPATQTTLLEGSVKINNTIVLKPGQQASLMATGVSVKNVNTDEISAWKNGLFEFSNASIESVMRQLSRWYDVEIIYEGQVPKTVINGEVYRNMNGDKVLEVLKSLKIHFRIQGRKIYVTK